MSLDLPPLSGQKLGIIGLGHMGHPMAKRLKNAGAQVYIHSRNRSRLEELEQSGMIYCSSAAEMAEKVDTGTLLVCVSDTSALEEVVHGDYGILTGLQPGALVIDMGTSQVMNTRSIAALIQQKGACYLDAPVSGGVVGAEEGTLSIMVGGTEEGFLRAGPLFDVLGKNISHIGPSGTGQITKAANQMIVAMTIDAVAEALVLAQAAGADPGKVQKALRGGFADSRILELHGKRMIDRTFQPGATATIQLKDVHQALELADHSGVTLPGLSKNAELWENMLAQGLGQYDQSGFICMIENLQSIQENKQGDE
ncbi:NAD(P)-dependent oxidoreductase [Kiloniella laminariae]|uniref:NAD(P)-dependent oxidoreductase n=1 Tax=Kiloniella laminariae TaxID=454162 RepID=A0ABT4LP10_9PROT|nr:NAD(P)-dependent oxidoreductase [Kiloniella laminariae]MCZ4282786.1 NAD(P)-dependent oxidoreductase [Kiloniella laminariae]